VLSGIFVKKNLQMFSVREFLFSVIQEEMFLILIDFEMEMKAVPILFFEPKEVLRLNQSLISLGHWAWLFCLLNILVLHL